MSIVAVPLLAAPIVAGACSRDPSPTALPVASATLPASPPSSTSPAITNATSPVERAEAAPPLAIDEVAVDGDLPIYVVRPSPGAPDKMRVVFLTGSCTHPTEVLSSFRHAGAARGGVVALQGDLPCKGDPKLRKWSGDTRLTSRRIDDALRAAGVTEANDLTLVGYSQGAERAEWLANRFPAKYTRFVLVASPIPPEPARFSGARAVVTMAGRGDEREHMWIGARRLRAASIPSVYFEIPSRHHGQVDPAADTFFGEALDWLDEHARPLHRPARATAGGGHERRRR